MIEKSNIKEFEWIKQGKKRIMNTNEKNWKWNTVESLLPNKFDKYIKILHPIYKDKLVRDKNILWYEIYNDEGTQGERILWKELAEEYNVKFKSEINSYAFFKENDRKWPRYLLGPNEGTLEVEQVDEIINILKPLNCEKYFYYYELLKVSNWSQDKLFEGNLEGIHELMKSDDIIEPFEKNCKYSPSYWWDENKTVCICSDYDLAFTIVGCDKELFTSFMKSSCLECIEVVYNTRIDYEAMEH